MFAGTRKPVSDRFAGYRQEPLGGAGAPGGVAHGDYMFTLGRLPQKPNLAVFGASPSKITTLV
jgi:hypothetical protein